MERSLPRRTGAMVAWVALLAALGLAGAAVGLRWVLAPSTHQVLVATAPAPLASPSQVTPAPPLEAAQSSRAPAPAEYLRARELVELQASAEAKREEQRAAALAAAAARKLAWETSRAWADAATQVREPAARARALAELQAALQGDDPALAEAALLAIPSLWDVAFDKAAVAAAVRPHFASEEGRVRHAALRAPNATGPSAADLPLLLRLAEDPERDVRGELGQVLRSATSGALEGPMEAAMLRLLADEEQLVARNTMSALGACRLTPALEEALLDPGADRERKGNVIHFVLNRSTAQSDRSLDFLTDALADPLLCATASTSLRRSVPEPARPRIADKVLAVLQESASVWQRTEVLGVLESLAGEEQLAALEDHAANPMLGERERAATRRTLDAVRRRLAGAGR